MVGSGKHDGEILFGQWALLVHDSQIGGGTRGVGWLGMVGSVIWLVWMYCRSRGRERQLTPALD